MRHVPPWVFLVAGLAYLLWPWDLAMDFLGFVGWIDDLIVSVLAVYMAVKALRAQLRAARGGPRPRREGPRPPAAQDESGPEPEDPRAILGLEADASPEEIRDAYRREMSKYHPDKVAHLGEDLRTVAERRTKLIQRAYEDLTGS